MRKPQTVTAIIFTLLFSIGFAIDVDAQRWKKVKRETLYARNRSKKLTPIYVGIGVKNPTAQFHTTGTVRMEGIQPGNGLNTALVIDGSGNLFWRDFSSSLGNAWFLNGNAATAAQFLGTINSEDLRLRTNNLQRAVITSAGLVGIGTGTPSAQLHTTGTVRFEAVASNNALLRFAAFDNSGNLFYRDLSSLNSSFWGLTGNGGTNPATNFLGTTDNNRLVIRTNNIERMTALTNGQVGIGTSAPLAQLHVSNAAGAILNYPYETAVFEKTGDNKLAVMSTDATGVGGASITLGHSNFTAAGLFPGYEMQYGNNNQRYLRFNYLPRNASGVITGETANILVMTDNSRVGVNLGPTGGGPTPIFPTANFHVNGTVRLQGLVNGTGNPLVADANGNVFLGSGLTNFWSLIGNSGTNPATNFLGTTDNNRLVFRTNNTEKMTILSNGRVGINNTNPSSQLVITNTTTEDSHLKVEGLAPSLVFEGSLGSLFAGRVGYATINNNYVNGSVPGDMIVQTLGATSNLIFGVGGGGTGNGFERMRINSQGFLGIATASPTATLHTNGTVRFQNLVAGTGTPLVADANGNVFLGSSSTNSWSLVGNSATNPATNFLGTTDNNRLVIRTNNIERMTALTNGRVGIGTAAPLAQFHVSNAAGAILNYPYETAVFEKTGDNKLAVLSSDATGVGGASITLGHSNFTSGGLFPGYEMQYGINSQRYLRFNYLPRNASGVITGETANILIMTDNSRVGINLGPTGGGATPVFPTANFHVSGTVRMQGLPTGAGSALVMDANGNVFRSTILAGRSTNEDVRILQDEIDALKKEMEELKKLVKSCTSSLVSIKGK